jgi:hypothetical protein
MRIHWCRTVIVPAVAFVAVVVGCAILILFQGRSCGSLSGGRGLVYVYFYGPVLVLASGVVLSATTFLCRRATMAVQVGSLIFVSCGIIWMFANLAFADPAPEFAASGGCPAGVPNWWPSFLPIMR